MQDVKYISLMFLFTLLALGGCSRREVLDNYPVSGVEISLDWDGVTDKLPDGVRVIFYPINGAGRKVDTYLSVRGGSVKVPPGRYSVVVYNYDTETVQIRNEGAYETIQAFTGHCNGLGIAGTEKLIWGPDPLYVVNVDELQIKKSDEALLLNWKPEPVVKTYSFKVKAEGLQYVSAIVGVVDGMAGCYCLGKCHKMIGEAPIYFEGVARAGEIVGSFTAFGMPGNTVTRAESGVVKLMLAFVKTDKSVHKVEVDVTDVITDSESGGGEEGPSKEIELPLEEDIVIEKPDNPSGGGDGGIGGDVGDWGDEEDVELPMK
ncbi:DUF5119 domain-containing protein [Bacteroides sp.]|uniref:DUF5119 domain-containing protein n=1 Tax=Bacteroides sp. TaxID=29523 RepID=UPI002634084C|nr:DUF5119 domain-containing protein [Bacteroides sp.]MDD3036571.1 DUF5119 domain-containing protein [Bacteroides sp.]